MQAENLPNGDVADSKEIEVRLDLFLLTEL